ncbi:hypothetical protein AXF42_Ash018281 [Apostasia shenzhenica]|uniref:Uncharacterized protein n=1 Tax=Apostasia shenzhenica TaxID=1088818 RepID=A0A2I0B2P7_9ASPA|nr:hypothetical protein AXF42_Ash018281 [Apostasia shenzhenica]
MEVEAQRRRSSSASSPEFEFSVVRNPFCPSPEMLTADELFSDGVLLPLQFLSLPRSDHAVQPSPDPPPSPPTFPPAPPLVPPASILLAGSSSSSSSAPSSVSRRWKDLFRVVSDKKPEEKEKDRKKARKGNAGGSSAELNINIWPFSRSRSAGNAVAGSSRARTAVRKVSSAPCSRSNSRGESSKPAVGGFGGGGSSTNRRLAASPGRGGVHLGRTSPVWQIRRPAVAAPKEKSGKSSTAGPATGDGGGPRVLNLKVNSCIGYGNTVSLRTEDSDGVSVTGGDCTAEASTSHGSLFSLRTFFSKKVH